MILSQRQKEVVNRISKKGIVWWKIGEGKTRIALAWMLENFVTFPRPLIICAPGAVRQWLDEMEKTGTRRLIEPQFFSSGLLSGGENYVFDEHAISCIIVDELWMYKNPGSKRSKFIRQLTRRVPVLGLSGSLMTAGNLEDLYGQTRALNLDSLVANNMTDFRSKYMIEISNYYNERGYGQFVRRYPRKDAVKAIAKKLAGHVDIYFPAETKEIRDIPVNVDPTPEQDRIRRKLVNTYMYEELEIKTATALLTKLQQVSDGFLRTGKGSYLSVRSAKMVRLRELCTELLDAGERLLIWVGFRKTAELLSKAFNFKTLILSGDGKFDVEAWRRGRAQVTIATVGSGASLNDFAHVRYAIFYSTTFNSLNLQQAKGRTNRKSSLHRCCYYYFMATKDFPDRQIYQGIEDNKNKEQIVIETAKRMLEYEYQKDS